MSNYYITFCSVAKDIDIEHTYDSIKKLQSSKNKENIEKLGKLLSGIDGNVPNDREHHYLELKALYDGLVFLKDTYDKWDKLTLEEQSNVNTEMMRMEYYYQIYKKKK